MCDVSPHKLTAWDDQGAQDNYTLKINFSIKHAGEAVLGKHIDSSQRIEKLSP
jgi:hypothetical protein